MNWKELFIIFGGIFFLWWLEKQHQMMMLQLQMGFGVPQAPMYPQPPAPFTPTAAPAYQPPLSQIRHVQESGPTWAGRPRGGGGNGGGAGPLRLVLQVGQDGTVWGGNY